MKNKKIILIAILALAIGFATVTTTLYINGQTKIVGDSEGFAGNVIFTSATTDSDGSATIEQEGKEITYTSKTLKALNDEAVLNFEISNLDKNYDVNATIACKFINADLTESDTNDYVTLTLDKTSYEIPSGGKANGILTAKLVAVSETEQNLSIKCTINANAVERDSVGEITKENNNILTGTVTDSDNNILTTGYLAVYSDEMKVVTIGTDGSISVSNLEDGTHEIYYMGATDPTGKTKSEVKDSAQASGTFTTTMTNETIVLSKGDTKYYINNFYVGEPNTLVAVSFADDSWETIAAAVKSGTYPYNVGDTKTIDMGDLGTHTLRIANTSKCTNGETSETACGFVVEFADIITEHVMNSGATNVGGWPASEMRTYVNGTVYNALPSDLQSVIAETTVVSGHGSTSGEINFTSKDKLYLLSAHEVWSDGTSNAVSTYDTSYSETRQLDYYANLGVTPDNYSGAIKQYNGSNDFWWLRSAYSLATDFFVTVTHDGNCTSNFAIFASGVSPAFRIA